MSRQFAIACTHYSPAFHVNVRGGLIYYGETRACSSETVILILLAEVKNNDSDRYKDSKDW